MKNLSHQNEPLNSLEFHSKLLSTGNEQTISLPLKQKVDIEDTSLVISTLENQILTLQSALTNNQQIVNNPSHTVESLPSHNVKIWKDKLNTSETDSLTIKLSQTLDLVSTLKEKDLMPFWTSQSKEISKKLWLPTKIDSVVSVLNSSKESSTNTPMGKSWFSINKKLPLKKNLQETSFQLSQFFLLDSTDLEVTNLNRKSKNPAKPLKQYKTLKVRLFPTDDQKETLKLMISQQRWYYNALISIMNKRFSKEQLYLESRKVDNPKEYESNSWSAINIREILRQYEYHETIETIEGKEVVIKDFKFKKEELSFPVPRNIQTGEKWWDSVHNRIPRGAVSKYASSLNSGITNLREGNIRSHKMKFKTKKETIHSLHFDDSNFPSICTKIKSMYWFRVPRNQHQRRYEKTGTRKMRSCLSLSNIISQAGKNGLEVIYDQIEEKYFIHYPVNVNWYPTQDIRNERQDTDVKDTIISLDPGVRKFLVGYDPKGTSIFFGEDVQKKMISLLLDIDDSKNDDDKKKQVIHRKWTRIQNLINEMHWKCISYLVNNYETIMYPDYCVSGMLKKNKIGKMTKRLMTMYSSFKFKERLKYQCKKYGRHLIIVDESYTSRTCGQCGNIHHNLNGNKVFTCPRCKISMDRDASGSRNILLKNLRIKSAPKPVEEFEKELKDVLQLLFDIIEVKEKKTRKSRVIKIKE